MLTIPCIDTPATLADAALLLANQPRQEIACVNWPKEYPYAPTVTFAMVHDGENIYLQYEVHETCTMARVTEDNGEVWTDSCVEFFFAPDDTGYYNLECTCIGRILLGYHSADTTILATPKVLTAIERLPSLGTEPFAERTGNNQWRITLKIPKTSFFRHHIPSWEGMEARANFYKCGDKLSRPHFLSWSPIDYPKPNFHLPAFFAPVHFEPKRE